MQLTDRDGVKYQLSRIVGKGGEATVYRVAGQPQLLAKVYRAPTSSRHQKLSWMISNPPEDPSSGIGHISISWPLDILFQKRKFTGYLMPHIQDTVKILSVFHPRLRLQTFHGFSQKHLYNTAYNIAAAIGAIHHRGYVIGDLNESNVLVSRSTLVTIIDTDSFQVHSRNPDGSDHLHHCTVGKPEYLPPEMQGKDLTKIERQPVHDCFALGVLVFQLLMNGNHPFRARWLGDNEKPALPERIEKGYFPYRAQLSHMIAPYSDMDILHPLVKDLMMRCFILGYTSPAARPSPGEWERVLSESVRSLVACRNGHYHSPHLKNCPECQQPGPTIRPKSRTRSTLSQNKISQKPTPSPSPPKPLNIQPQPAVQNYLPHSRHYPNRFQRWFTFQNLQGLILQPAAWGVFGTISGALVGYQFSPETGAHVLGLLCGLVSGALVGDLIEKKVGWEVFFALMGSTIGLATWYFFGSSSSVLNWLAAAGVGGTVGMIIGRYGRFAELTLAWAVIGAVGGWFSAEQLLLATIQNWSGAAMTGAIAGLITGIIYRIWRIHR